MMWGNKSAQKKSQGRREGWSGWAGRLAGWGRVDVSGWIGKAFWRWSIAI
jgi:hypothetical protein